MSALLDDARKAGIGPEDFQAVYKEKHWLLRDSVRRRLVMYTVVWFGLGFALGWVLG